MTDAERSLGLFIDTGAGRGYWYILTETDQTRALTWLGDAPEDPGRRAKELLQRTPWRRKSPVQMSLFDPPGSSQTLT